ncbi:putative tRNA 2'-phosphotransferase 1 [Xylariaceae sp. FL0804]|nr:putative tRNA 2'-phosphotransferase 1 [Xylariaceae sp. FL0804]
MAAASVLIPLDVISQNGGVLPPSALSQAHAPRQGRSRGMSVHGHGHGHGGKSAGFGRGYRVVEDVDGVVAKAVAFALRRAVVAESDVDESGMEEEEEGDYLVCDADGWVSVADLLSQARLTDLGISLADVRRASASSKARFALRQKPGSTDAAAASSYQARRESKRDSAPPPPTTSQLVPEGEPLTASSADLPEYVVFETTYPNYARIVASGGLRRADGASHLSFLPVSAARSAGRPSKADVSIWVHLRTAMATAPEVAWWRRAGNGRAVAIATSAEEVPTALWKKAVARRPDIGLLFEDGAVTKEIPEGLRGKGGKGKAKKGTKGLLRQEGRVDNNSDSSDSVEDDA